MPPKKNKKNQDDDELDKKFEQKQALLEKQSQQKQGNNDNDSDDNSAAKKNKNIFEQIKHVEAATAQQAKKKKETQPKSEQNKEQEQQSKQVKKEILVKQKKQEQQEQSSEEDQVAQDSSSDSEEERNVKNTTKKQKNLFTQKEEEVDGCGCNVQHEKPEKKNKKKEMNAENSTQKKEKSKEPVKDEELFKSNAKNENYCDPMVVIFLVGTLLLMFVFKYYGDNYKRYNYSESNDNLYSVLEVEPSASAQDLKNSYKRLATLWHPDKNQNCGDVCKEKFYKITEAWKILGNPKNRESYDSSHGVLQMIKSKAITLTGANYDSLVLQSTDVWIIQVYMNGDDACKRMSPFWETIINTYGHVVKFGRIDAEIDYKLVQRLPFASPIFPTIFSFSHYDSPQLITISSYNIEAEISKFVQKAVVSKLKLIKQEQAGEIYNSISSYSPNKPIDIVYLFANDRIPIEFKYAALQNSKEFNFYTNSYGQQINVFKTTKNFIVFINDEEKQIRSKYEFDFGKSFNSQKFYKILNYLNFRVTPDISKENFKYYCKNQQSQQDGENELENDYQTLCIFLFKQSPQYEKYLELANKYRKQYKASSIEKFASGERIFDNYHNIQIVSIDLNKHWRFRKVMEAYIADPKFNHPIKTLHAAAFLEENKKISLLHNVNEFEDWILDLQDNVVDFEYLTEYLPTQDESSLFLFSQDTPLRLLGKSLFSNAIDYRTIVTVIIGFIGLLFKFNAQIALTWTVSLFFLSVISLGVLETYEDFLYIK